MIRGMMSKGQIFSVPASWPYTLKVMPMFSRARSAAFCRRCNSPSESEASRWASTAPRARGWPSASNISS